MKEFISKDMGHSLVVMTADSFQKALEVVYARAKEAVLAEIRTPAPGECEMMITKGEAMSLLGKSANTLWKWSRRGYLVPTKVGGRVMYKTSDINRILGYEKEC